MVGMGLPLAASAVGAKKRLAEGPIISELAIEVGFMARCKYIIFI